MDYEDTPVPKYKTDLCESRPVVVTMKGIEDTPGLRLAGKVDASFNVGSRSRIDQRCEIEQEFCTLNFAENFYHWLVGTFFLVVPDNSIFKNQIFTTQHGTSIQQSLVDFHWKLDEDLHWDNIAKSENHRRLDSRLSMIVLTKIVAYQAVLSKCLN